MMNDNLNQDNDLYEQIAKRRYEYDYTSPWEHLAPTPRRLLTQAARNTMEPIIARVRRDAAREALDGYSKREEERVHRLHVNGEYAEASKCGYAALTARAYLHLRYHEETP